MAKKGMKLGVTSALIAGAGAAALMAKKAKENEKERPEKVAETKSEYRNTERGKDAKTVKVFTIPMEIMKHLPVRRSRRV